MVTNLAVPQRELETFCQRWQVSELALFGSVLRADFSSDSDIDMLVTFKAGVKVKFADFLRMEEELTDILGRKVDLGTRRSVEDDPNYLRRREILNSAEVVYAE
ncbi:MAG: nucleotidyltransferase domain-containing protein [Chloroflexota bacterium]